MATTIGEKMKELSNNGDYSSSSDSNDLYKMSQGKVLDAIYQMAIKDFNQQDVSNEEISKHMDDLLFQNFGDSTYIDEDGSTKKYKDLRKDRIAKTGAVSAAQTGSNFYNTLLNGLGKFIDDIWDGTAGAINPDLKNIADAHTVGSALDLVSDIGLSLAGPVGWGINAGLNLLQNGGDIATGISTLGKDRVIDPITGRDIDTGEALKRGGLGLLDTALIAGTGPAAKLLSKAGKKASTQAMKKSFESAVPDATDAGKIVGELQKSLDMNIDKALLQDKPTFLKDRLKAMAANKAAKSEAQEAAAKAGEDAEASYAKKSKYDILNERTGNARSIKELGEEGRKALSEVPEKTYGHMPTTQATGANFPATAAKEENKFLSLLRNAKPQEVRKIAEEFLENPSQAAYRYGLKNNASNLEKKAVDANKTGLKKTILNLPSSAVRAGANTGLNFGASWLANEGTEGMTQQELMLLALSSVLPRSISRHGIKGVPGAKQVSSIKNKVSQNIDTGKVLDKKLARGLKNISKANSKLTGGVQYVGPSKVNKALANDALAPLVAASLYQNQTRNKNMMNDYNYSEKDINNFLDTKLKSNERKA